MSAPAVKPALPAPNTGGQTSTPSATSPLKNHAGSANLSITVMNDKAPEKPKDQAQNVSPKPTPNGVDSVKSAPPINDKKEETNHITATTGSTTPVNNVSQPQITAPPPKGTPDKSQPASNAPPGAANNSSPKTASSATPSGQTTPEKQSTPVKASPVQVEEKEKTPTPISTTPTTPKRVVEKPEKQEKQDKEKGATPSRIKRKRENATPSAVNSSEDADKGSKRTRVPVQPYQSPMADLFPGKVKLPSKAPVEKEKEKDTDKEKLVIFYKNEFLAVRNSEGSFYVCQAMQNVYKTSHKIKIRWLSQVDEEKAEDGTVYSPDFYDTTDFDCILTSLRLQRMDKGKYNLSKEETLRTENILKRALDVEKGVSEKPELTEEHPDGLDLSLFKDEAQLKKRKSQSKRTSGSPKRARRSETPSKKEVPKTDKKKISGTPKRTPVRKVVSPKTGRKARSASVGKSPKKVKEEKSEKMERQTASTRAERASGREKAKEAVPSTKTPVKRKAESPAPQAETKPPKTTARTAASAKKAAAEAKAAAQAALAAAQEASTSTQATPSPSPAGRKPPTRGRRGVPETPDQEIAAPQSRSTKRNARTSSPMESEKESKEAAKDESKPAESTEAPVPTASVGTSATTTSAEATPATSVAVTTATGTATATVSTSSTSDSTATPSEPKPATPAETSVTALDGNSEVKSQSSDASPNRGGPKKTTAPTPPKKA